MGMRIFELGIIYSIIQKSVIHNLTLSVTDFDKAFTINQELCVGSNYICFF
jgi:hypothetical protein